MALILTKSFYFFRLSRGALLLYGFLFPYSAAPLEAQENPYIVAYDHNLEEPGNLEIEYFSTFGTQRGGPGFHAFGLSSNTEPRPGGPRSSTWTARAPSIRARCLPASVGKTAFDR